jgi:alpha-D-xyloside xylohydrolase
MRNRSRQAGRARSRLARFGLARFGLARFGLARFGLARFGLARSGSASLLLAGLVGAAGCGPAAGPEDAGLDAELADAAMDAPLPLDAATTPFTLAIDDGAGARLEVATNPLRVRLVRSGGEVALESSAEALELGISPTGDLRYNDVTVPDPRRVVWHALALGIVRTSETEGLVGDGAGRTARITLSRVGEGVLRMRVAVEAGQPEVGLVRARFLADDGSYQGLGERFTGADARGWVVPMQMSVTTLARESGLNEHHVPVPFVVSSRAWGLFVESREAGAFDVGAADAAEVRATFEGSAMEYVFFVDDSPAEVIAAYTRHTGLPILPPRWSFAPMHWRNVWDDRDQLETDARALVDLRIPATAFWIDNPWMTSYTDNLFDERRFPGHIEMLQRLRDSGFRPLVWNVPYLDAPDDGVADNPAERLYEEAAREGYLVRVASSGQPFAAPSALGVSGLGAAAGMIDFTSERATDFWRARLDPLVRDLGIRAFKLDYGEDVVPELGGVRIGLSFADGTTERETHNVYAMRYHTPYRRALDAHSDEGGFLLVRASCWGGQTVADIVWPGDIDSDLSRGDARNVGGLPAAISAMLSLAASGFPNFASDTGGFREGPVDLETLMRWAEHTAFSPFLQLGGSGEHHNPWLYEPTAQIPDPTGTYRELARAHTELIPFFRLHARRASLDGTPPVLHPSLAFPEDRGGYADPDAYVLGGDLFVAAVVTPGASTRSLHLPPGRWVHWLTGEVFEGPRDLTVDAPVGRPPVFVRVGAIVPMLAHDLETLVASPTPLGVARIDPSDRPYLRARLLPSGTASITTEEGVSIGYDHTAGLVITLAPVAAPAPDLGLRDVRLAVDLAHARPSITTVTALEVDGIRVPQSPLATVETGCVDVCWALEGTTLRIAAIADRPRTLAVR